MLLVDPESWRMRLAVQIQYVELLGKVKRNDSDESIPAEEQHILRYVKHAQHAPAMTAGKWILMTTYRCVILQL